MGHDSWRPSGRCGCLPALLATIAVASGCGESEPRRPAEVPPIPKSGYCDALRGMAEQVGPRLDQRQLAELKRQVEESCRRGPVYAPAPTTTPGPASSFPGCEALEPQGPRRVALRRGIAEPPERPVPFFARRVGTLPPDGRATVAGVHLPHGSRCMHYWVTDSVVPDAVELARRLAAAFPQTGLWPVLWGSPNDDPDRYMNATGDPLAADRLDPEELLAATWAQYGGGGDFPGLAAGFAGMRTGADATDPFATVEQFLPGPEPPETRWLLMLVPCHRPADVISVLGPETTEVMDDDSRTAVLRSWEERFGAVLTVMRAGEIGLDVSAPPRTRDHALGVAAEQFAFAPEDDHNFGSSGAPFPDLPGVAQRLLAAEPIPGYRSRHFWLFAWPD